MAKILIRTGRIEERNGTSPPIVYGRLTSRRSNVTTKKRGGTVRYRLAIPTTLPSAARRRVTYGCFVGAAPGAGAGVLAAGAPGREKSTVGASREPGPASKYFRGFAPVTFAVRACGNWRM